MKHLHVTRLSVPDTPYELLQISKLLDTQSREELEFAPWAEYPYKPEVHFSIAYDSKSVFLKYYVKEAETRAIYTEINDPVYRDSCVEFFISLDGGLHYYNFEFNSKGTCLAGFGKNRDNRELLSAELIKQISYLPTGHPETADRSNSWELCLMIPVEVFYNESACDLEGRSVKANFYKCGDDLAQPHFLAWNNIKSQKPNFHLPEYFGELTFTA